MANKHERYELEQYQSLPLSAKVNMTQQRIKAWVEHWGVDGVCVSFSGGKDSTVLLHLVREMYPDVKAVFFDTGLEYPEIRNFVKTFTNVDWLKPKMTFRQVIEKHGYPMISKEVSECVSGAKKYLTNVWDEMNASQTDRQTDRRMSIGLTSSSKSALMKLMSEGGEQRTRFIRRAVREAAVEQVGAGNGISRFGRLLGIVNSYGQIDERLYSHGEHESYGVECKSGYRNGRVRKRLREEEDGEHP